MKYLVLFVLCLGLAIAQDNEPSQRSFTIGGSSQTLSGNSNQFKLDKFMLGWHWGFDDAKLDDAMYINIFPMFPCSAWEYSHHSHCYSNTPGFQALEIFHAKLKSGFIHNYTNFISQLSVI